jgi:hypothetical protein
VQKLARDGEPIWARGSPGRRLADFVRPRGLRIAPDGIIYVADAATEIIKLFNEDGQVLMHFGGPGTVPGALVLPATVAIDATSIPYFRQYVHEDFDVEYLLFVSSQYGEHLISVYAFGSFPEGYQLSQSQIASLPPAGEEPSTKPAEPSPGDGDQSGPADSEPQD